MADLSDSKRSQIVGAHMAGVTKTAELLNVARGIVSKVIRALEKEMQNLSATKLWNKAKAVLLGPSDSYAYSLE